MYLERLLRILETVAQRASSHGLTVSQIVDATGFPKPSVYRQVNDLVETGLLEPASMGRFVVGGRARRLFGDRQDDDSVRLLAVPLLKIAARDHGVTFFLAALKGHSVEIVHVETPPANISYLHPGLGARPMHACSCGKVVAAFNTEPALYDKLSNRVRALTRHTKTDLSELALEFETIREVGFAQCVEELEAGVCSVAAPLSYGSNGVQFSLGATGTTRVLDQDKRQDLGAILVRLCAELTLQLGEQSGVTGAALASP